MVPEPILQRRHEGAGPDLGLVAREVVLDDGQRHDDLRHDTAQRMRRDRQQVEVSFSSTIEAAGELKFSRGAHVGTCEVPTWGLVTCRA